MSVSSLKALLHPLGWHHAYAPLLPAAEVVYFFSRLFCFPGVLCYIAVIYKQRLELVSDVFCLLLSKWILDLVSDMFCFLFFFVWLLGFMLGLGFDSDLAVVIYLRGM